MLEKIIGILKNYSELPAEEITKDSLLISELGLNSLNMLELVCEIEEAFSVEIPDRSIMELTTVENVQKLIEKCLQEQ